MLREIADGITTAGERDDVKLIVSIRLQGFLRRHRTSAKYTSQRVFQMARCFSRSVLGHAGGWQPVVCVVNGPASGGGAELAAFGDLVIATPQSALCQPEISIGVFLRWPPPFAVSCRTQIALELVLTGEPVTAERAPRSRQWSIASSPKPSSRP